LELAQRSFAAALSGNALRGRTKGDCLALPLAATGQRQQRATSGAHEASGWAQIQKNRWRSTQEAGPRAVQQTSTRRSSTHTSILRVLRLALGVVRPRRGELCSGHSLKTRAPTHSLKALRGSASCGRGRRTTNQSGDSDGTIRNGTPTRRRAPRARTSCVATSKTRLPARLTRRSRRSWTSEATTNSRRAAARAQEGQELHQGALPFGRLRPPKPKKP